MWAAAGKTQASLRKSTDSALSIVTCVALMHGAETLMACNMLTVMHHVYVYLKHVLTHMHYIAHRGYT